MVFGKWRRSKEIIDGSFNASGWGWDPHAASRHHSICNCEGCVLLGSVSRHISTSIIEWVIMADGRWSHEIPTRRTHGRNGAHVWKSLMYSVVKCGCLVDNHINIRQALTGRNCTWSNTGPERKLFCVMHNVIYVIVFNKSECDINKQTLLQNVCTSYGH